MWNLHTVNYLSSTGPSWLLGPANLLFLAPLHSTPADLPWQTQGADIDLGFGEQRLRLRGKASFAPAYSGRVVMIEYSPASVICPETWKIIVCQTEHDSQPVSIGRLIATDEKPGNGPLQDVLRWRGRKLTLRRKPRYH